jgi:hypothetical protein
VPVFGGGGDLPTNVAWRNEIYVGDVAGEIARQPWYMLRSPEWTYLEWKSGAKELYD